MSEIPQNILVVGTGYMGRALLELLSTDFLTVTGINGPSGPSPNLDICDSGSISKTLTGFSPDSLIVAAAYTYRRARMAISNGIEVNKIKSQLKEINIKGIDNLTHAASRKGIKIIYISSAEVYQSNDAILSEDSPIVENDSSNLQRAFASSKTAAEQIVLQAGGNVLRPNNTYGASRYGSPPIYFPDFVLNRLISDQPIAVQNPCGARNYIDIRDVARACEAVVKKPDLRGLLVNIAGEELITNIGLAQRIATIINKPNLVTIADNSDRNLPEEHQTLNLSIDKARKKLGWIPIYSFERYLLELGTNLNNDYLYKI